MIRLINFNGKCYRIASRFRDKRGRKAMLVFPVKVDASTPFVWVLYGRIIFPDS